MLSTLAVGLACGVGVYPLAIFAAVFIVAVLYVIESFEPSARHSFVVEVKAKEAGKLQPKLEALSAAAASYAEQEHSCLQYGFIRRARRVPEPTRSNQS